MYWRKNCYIYDHLKKNGVYVYGKFINSDNKLIGFSKNFLDEKFKYFDYSILEADGSKKSPLKVGEMMSLLYVKIQIKL